MLSKTSEPYICKDILQNYILFGKNEQHGLKALYEYRVRCFLPISSDFGSPHKR